MRVSFHTHQHHDVCEMVFKSTPLSQQTLLHDALRAFLVRARYKSEFHSGSAKVIIVDPAATATYCRPFSV